MLCAIMDGLYQFTCSEWDEVSDEAKDLVRGGEGRGGRQALSVPGPAVRCGMVQCSRASAISLPCIVLRGRA